LKFKETSETMAVGRYIQSIKKLIAIPLFCCFVLEIGSRISAFHVNQNFQFVQQKSFNKAVSHFSKGETSNLKRGQLFARGTGSTEKYSWIEDEYEVEVQLVVPPETSGKDVEFEVHRESVYLKVKGTGEPLIKGKTRGIVGLDGSFWTMEDEEDKKVIYLRLEKGVDADEADNTWYGVIEGEEQIEKDYSDEDFDVKKYVEKMGGINEDLVDKEMYTADKMDQSIMDKIQDPEKLKEMYQQWDAENDLTAGIDTTTNTNEEEGKNSQKEEK